MAEGAFPDFFATNAKYTMAPPLMNVFDDKILGGQTKLRSIFGEGWLKAIMGDDFDGAWAELQKKWLAADGQEVIANGQEYYKKNK